MGIRIATLLCLAVWLATGRSVHADPKADSNRNLALPIYSPTQLRPVAIVRAASSRRDHLQKGFLKIGLFPIIIVEELDIEIRQPKLFQDALARTSRLLSGRKRIRGLEIHGFRLHGNSGGKQTFDISAKRARHMNGIGWRLNQTTINGKPHSAAFLLTGPDGPRLLLPDGSPINLINHHESQSTSRIKKNKP